VKDIEIFSIWEQDLDPFTGKMHIGYILCGKVQGVAKFARIAEVYTQSLQLQERLMKTVANQGSASEIGMCLSQAGG